MFVYVLFLLTFFFLFLLMCVVVFCVRLVIIHIATDGEQRATDQALPPQKKRAPILTLTVDRYTPYVYVCVCTVFNGL